MQFYQAIFNDRVYPPTAYTGRFLQFFSGGDNHHKLVTTFRQTKVVTTSCKATRPQKLSP